MKKHAVLISLSFSLSVLMVSCVSPQKPELPAPALVETTAPEQSLSTPQAEDGERVEEAVFIQDVHINYPIPGSGSAEVDIDAFFPDACTELTEIMQSREENTFTIRLLTNRPDDAQCAMALEPFSVSVPLDLSGINDGEVVQVVVYEFSQEFITGQTAAPVEGGG